MKKERLEYTPPVGPANDLHGCGIGDEVLQLGRLLFTERRHTGFQITVLVVRVVSGKDITESAIQFLPRGEKTTHTAFIFCHQGSCHLNTVFLVTCSSGISCSQVARLKRLIKSKKTHDVGDHARLQTPREEMVGHIRDVVERVVVCDLLNPPSVHALQNVQMCGRRKKLTTTELSLVSSRESTVTFSLSFETKTVSTRPLPTAFHPCRRRCINRQFPNKKLFTNKPNQPAEYSPPTA